MTDSVGRQIIAAETIERRLVDVQQRIADAARRGGRDPGEVTLILVTKTWPASVVIEAYEAGIRHFGENRAGELAGKRSDVEKVLGEDSGIIWHLIGALQSRKTTLAADNADVFHALDRLKIARRLSDRLEEIHKSLPTFIEINVSGELSKAGFPCWNWEEDERQRAQILEEAKKILSYPHLPTLGLMTMAPWQAGDHELAEIFGRLRRLSAWLEKTLTEGEWTKLSMGMSDDFEIAVQQGATHVRIGRAILGERTA